MGKKSLVRINFHWPWATGPLIKSLSVHLTHLYFVTNTCTVVNIQNTNSANMLLLKEKKIVSLTVCWSNSFSYGITERFVVVLYLQEVMSKYKAFTKTNIAFSAVQFN